MTAEHQSLMQGMSNFRAFQLGAQEFFTSAKAVWQADQRRRTRNLIVVGIVAALLTPGIWMAVDWAGEVVREVEQGIQIIDQWKQAHPSEFVKPQSMQQAPDPQDAKTELAK